MRERRGFSLLELLVVAAIASVLGALALPVLRTLWTGSATYAAATDLVSALGYARTQALSLRSSVVLCARGAAAASTPACAGPADEGYAHGWLAFLDEDGNAVPDAAEEVLRVWPAPASAKVTIYGNHNVRTSVRFSAAGASTTPGSFVLCDQRGWQEQGRYAYVIVLSRGGQIRSSAGDNAHAGLSVTDCRP